MLVEAGLRSAKTLGLDTCVLAMRAALNVYQRAGFKLLNKVVQDASVFGGEKEYAAYFLVKELEQTPRQAGEASSVPVEK